MRAYWLPFAMAILLSACAGSVETRVTSAGENGVSPASYILPSAIEAEGVELSRAKAIIAESLSAKGFIASDNAAVNVEVTLSSRPAALGLTAGTKQILATPRKKKPFQSCGDKEYRLSIAMTRIADGVELYRGSAAEYHCKMSLSEAAPSLASTALADLGQPKGAYILKRSGKN